MSGELKDAAVVKNEAQNRYEAEVDGEVAILEYICSNGQITFTHTKVPPSLEGRGLGHRLAQVALDDAQTGKLKVVPQCSFIAAFIERHPEYQALVQSE